MSNSKLVSFTKLSSHCNPRRNTDKIDTVTVHCMAGNLSVEACGNLFTNPKVPASSNYGIGSDGRIGLYVEESKRSWATSSQANDYRAVTIEVANDGGADTGWHASDKAIKSLTKLLADICRRNGIKRLLWKADPKLIGHPDLQNMTVHRWFANKACPGDYIYGMLGEIAENVNKSLHLHNKHKVAVSANEEYAEYANEEDDDSGWLENLNLTVLAEEEKLPLIESIDEGATLDELMSGEGISDEMLDDGVLGNGPETRFLDNLPVTMPDNIVLSPESEENCRVVYRQDDADSDYYFYGLWDPDEKYTEDCIVVPIRSTGARTESLPNGTEFANILGSSNDPKSVPGHHNECWIELLKKFNVNTSACMTDRQFYEIETGKVFDQDRKTDPLKPPLLCSGTNMKGGHVVLGRKNKDKDELIGKDVYLIPICANHNSFTLGSGHGKGPGAGFFMKLSGQQTVLVLSGFMQRNVVRSCEEAMKKEGDTMAEDNRHSGISEEKAMPSVIPLTANEPLYGAETDPADPDKASFIDQVYDQVASVLGGDDANQYLCLTIPGQALSATDYAYDYKNMSPKGPTVEANESRLANKLFDPARVTGTDNGLTLPYQYKTALDMLSPKLNEKIAVAKNQLRRLLMTEYPYDFGDGSDKTYTLQEVFFRLYDDWAAESKKWADLQNAKKEELRKRYSGTDAASNTRFNDAYLEWYETEAEGHLNVINEKMSRVISVFTPNDMKILEGILDAGSGAELQQARRTLNNTQKLTPTGGYVYPVSLSPTNWFEYLDTSFTPIDILKTPDVLSSQMTTLSSRRMVLHKHIEDLASIIPSNTELDSARDAVNGAKGKLNDAENQLLDDYKEGFKAVLDAAFDLAPLFTGGSVPVDILKRLIGDAGYKEKIDDMAKALGDVLAKSATAQQEYVQAGQRLADASMKAVNAANLYQLKDVLSPLKTQLDEIDLEIKNLQSQIRLSHVVSDSESSVNPPRVPEGFTQIYIEADASAMDKETSKAASSGTSTAGFGFWFCGYRSESSSQSASFSEISGSEKTTVEIGMNVAKVGIERDWFNPGVFALTKDMFNVTDLRVSPNPGSPYTSMSDSRIRDMASSGYVFPCYPVAMVIARDVSIKFKAEKSFSSEFSDMVERHSSSGGGFLFFSGQSASSSSSSSSGVHSSIKGNTITLKFDTPQIIGYYMEATPADKSTYLDDVAGNAQAGYVTISRFVEDYRKILEEMAKKNRPSPDSL